MNTSQDSLLPRETLLQAVANATSTLLSQHDIDTAMHDALSIIGHAVEQDRVYVFEHHTTPMTGENLMSQRYEWARENVSVQIDNPELQNLSFDQLFPRWYELLSQGKPVAGLVADFPESERSILEPQDIIALMVVPVKVEDRFWGFIGFDNCHTAYQWSADDQAILASMAASIGSAIMRHRWETALHETNRMLDAANEARRAKRQFLANMSHEIRTPLNAITGLTHLMLDTRLDEHQHNYMRELHGAAKSLTNIINNILDFSKIEAGKLELESTPFQLKEIVNNSIQLLRQQAIDKGLDLRTDIHDELLNGERSTFWGDPVRLEQILLNLLSNGIKFTAKGHVVLKIEEVKHSSTQRILSFCVEDSGIGLKTETIGRLFQEFIQADNSTTRRHGGTGLGLSIVKGLLDLMGGTIHVNSKPHHGSRFTFTLPFRQPPEYSSAETNPLTGTLSDNSKHLEGWKILLVDDDVLNQMVASEILTRFGAQVECANNGVECIDKLTHPQAMTFDVVLMDIQMPIMDGYETTKWLRAQQDFITLPIVALSANVMEEEVVNCTAAGMNAHLAKPFYPHELLQTVMAQLSYQ